MSLYIQEAGLLQKVTAEQMPMFVENDAHSLYVLRHHLTIAHLGFAVLLQPGIKHTPMAVMHAPWEVAGPPVFIWKTYTPIASCTLAWM